jgi:hypothetical protein
MKFIVNKCVLKLGEGKIEFFIQNIFDQKIVLVGKEKKSVYKYLMYINI